MGIELSVFFEIIYIMCMGALPSYKPVHHFCAVTSDARRGHQICRLELQTALTSYVSAGNIIPVLRKNREFSYHLNHLHSPQWFRFYEF